VGGEAIEMPKRKEERERDEKGHYSCLINFLHSQAVGRDVAPWTGKVPEPLPAVSVPNLAGTWCPIAPLPVAKMVRRRLVALDSRSSGSQMDVLSAVLSATAAPERCLGPRPGG
jgi:hypothetical protein